MVIHYPFERTKNFHYFESGKLNVNCIYTTSLDVDRIILSSTTVSEFWVVDPSGVFTWLLFSITFAVAYLAL